MAERFYVKCPLAIGPVALAGPEAHHLATVCRLRPGHQVCLFNGDGRQYQAQVVSLSRRAVALQVHAVEQPARELAFHLEIAAPLPKGDRVQFLVEKLTELGVSSFIPLLTERSIVQPREGKMDKLERYVIEASKQCGRNILMHIAPPTFWKSYCTRPGLPEWKIVAQPGGASFDWPAACDLAAAVGPEGGFTEEELRLAVAAGWRPVSLGPRILRIETAALVLAARATW